MFAVDGPTLASFYFLRYRFAYCTHIDLQNEKLANNSLVAEIHVRYVSEKTKQLHKKVFIWYLIG